MDLTPTTTAASEHQSDNHSSILFILLLSQDTRYIDPQLIYKVSVAVILVVVVWVGEEAAGSKVRELALFTLRSGGEIKR